MRDVGLAEDETAGACSRKRAAEPRNLAAIAEHDRPPSEDPLEHDFEDLGHCVVDLDTCVEALSKNDQEAGRFGRPVPNAAHSPVSPRDSSSLRRVSASALRWAGVTAASNRCSLAT